MPGPASFNTPFRIIQLAMINSGHMAQGDEPTPDQYAEYLPRLNDLVNFWQTKGLKLWLNVDQEVILTAGQALYTFAPGGDVDVTKPMRFPSGYYLDVSDNRRPISPISWQEYTSLSNVVQEGSINSYFVDKQRTQLDVYLWQTPDAEAATGTVHLIMQRQATELINLTDDLDFPQEWFIALHWGLADEISTGMPKAVQDRCERRAKELFEALEAWDVEDASTMFTPDSRQYQNQGRFK